MKQASWVDLNFWLHTYMHSTSREVDTRVATGCLIWCADTNRRRTSCQSIWLSTGLKKVTLWWWFDNCKAWYALHVARGNDDGWQLVNAAACSEKWEQCNIFAMSTLVVPSTSGIRTTLGFHSNLRLSHSQVQQSPTFDYNSARPWQNSSPRA